MEKPVRIPHTGQQLLRPLQPPADCAARAGEEPGRQLVERHSSWVSPVSRSSADTGSGLTTFPRQRLASAPYALQAEYAATSPWDGLTGVPAGFADGVDDDVEPVIVRALRPAAEIVDGVHQQAGVSRRIGEWLQHRGGPRLEPGRDLIDLAAGLSTALISDQMGRPLQGGALLAVYALGMAAPLFVLAALWDRFDLGRKPWLRGRMLHLGLVHVHTTSLVSGVLFVVIGILFLRFDGTAGITGVLGLGDTTDLEFEAQRWIGEVTAAVPAWVLPAGIALLAGAVAWRRTKRRARPG